MEIGLRGMVALMKMSESWLRCRVLTRVSAEDLMDAPEYGDGVGEVSDENVVSSGESIWRFARGELGSPL